VILISIAKHSTTAKRMSGESGHLVVPHPMCLMCEIVRSFVLVGGDASAWLIKNATTSKSFTNTRSPKNTAS
jgi:hypothetical protein